MSSPNYLGDLYDRIGSAPNRRGAKETSDAIAGDLGGALILSVAAKRPCTPTRLPGITVKVPHGAPLAFLVHTDGVTQSRFIPSLCWNAGDPTLPIYLLLFDIGPEEDDGPCPFAIKLDPTADRHFFVDAAAAGGFELDLDCEFGPARYQFRMAPIDTLHALGEALDARLRWHV